MPLIKGNQSDNVSIANSASPPYTLTYGSHTVNTGSDRLLIAMFAHTTSINVSGVAKWNGVNMTQLGTTYDMATSNVRYSFWYIVNPDTGNLNLTMDFTGLTTMAVSCWSLQNASTVSIQHQGNANTPHNNTVNVSANSMILGVSTSAYSFDTNAITIDGTSFSYAGCEVSGSVSSGQLCAHLRDALLTAGNKTVTTDTVADSFQASNTVIYISSAAAVVTSTQGMLMMF